MSFVSAAPTLDNAPVEPKPRISKRSYYGAHEFDQVFAVGDVHGDLSALITCLTMPNEPLARRVDRGVWEWVARPRTALVVLGDCVDRMRPGAPLSAGGHTPGEQPKEELNILRLLNMLAKQAPKTDGAVIRLLGNHEFTQLMKHDAYLTEWMEMFATPAALREQGGVAGRVAYFRKDGLFNHLLRPGMAVVQIGGWAFLHGGLHIQQLEHVRQQKPGTKAFEYANWLAQTAVSRPDLNTDGVDIHKHPEYAMLMNNTYGMLWDRELGNFKREGRQSCPSYVHTLFDAFNQHNWEMGIDRLEHCVVAHCVQDMDTPGIGMQHENIWRQYYDDNASVDIASGGLVYRKQISDRGMVMPSINAECGGAIWRIDVGMSRGMPINGLATRPSMLRINMRDNTTSVIAAPTLLELDKKLLF